MAVEFNRVFDASKKFILISFGFNLLLFFIGIGLALLGFGAAGLATGSQTNFGAALGSLALVGIISLVLSGIGYLVNIAIIAFTGFEAAKKHNLDLISCGACGALVYVVVDIIMSVLGIISSIVLQSAMVFGGASALETSANMLAGLFCLFGVFVIGIVLNFAIGAIGGMIGGAK